METNFQSSEIRLPKTTTTATATTTATTTTKQSPVSSPQFKSSFARSLSFNTNNKPLDLELSPQRIVHSIDATPTDLQFLAHRSNLTMPARASPTSSPPTSSPPTLSPTHHHQHHTDAKFAGHHPRFQVYTIHLLSSQPKPTQFFECCKIILHFVWRMFNVCVCLCV